MIRLYNKGKRKFVFAKGFDSDGKPVTDERGKPIEQSIDAGKFANVDDAVAKTLIKRFPKEIVDVNNVDSMQQQFEETEVIERKHYLSPEDVDAKIKAAVDAALSGAKSEPAAPQASAAPQAFDITTLDRSELIEMIEAKNLNIDHSKLKHPDALKKAVMAALEEQNKAA